MATAQESNTEARTAGALWRTATPRDRADLGILALVAICTIAAVFLVPRTITSDAVVLLVLPAAAGVAFWRGALAGLLVTALGLMLGVALAPERGFTDAGSGALFVLLGAGASLAGEEVSRLARAVRTVLAMAIRVGGTTLRDYVGADGSPGYFRQKLYVYERAGKPCRTCRTTIRQLTQGQRSTYYCATCQK